MSQFISLDQAITMTTLYRQEKEKILAPDYQNQDILAMSETFGRDVFDALLAKPGCVSMRIYYGMDESLNVHAILVPVNSKNEDIVPPASIGLGDAGRDIGENSARCPPFCGASSPLNP
jgi:hypothetical protein